MIPFIPWGKLHNIEMNLEVFIYLPEETCSNSCISGQCSSPDKGQDFFKEGRLNSFRGLA